MTAGLAHGHSSATRCVVRSLCSVNASGVEWGGLTCPRGPLSTNELKPEHRAWSALPASGPADLLLDYDSSHKLSVRQGATKVVRNKFHAARTSDLFFYRRDRALLKATDAQRREDLATIHRLLQARSTHNPVRSRPSQQTSKFRISA